MFDSTVRDASHGTAVFRLEGYPEPRVEPELVLHLSKSPKPGMSETELLACVDWFAPGIEMVHSIFPGWRFSAADAAAAYGLHSALYIGTKRILDKKRSGALAALFDFSATLSSEEGELREGHASHVLGGPLTAFETSGRGNR